MTPQGHYEEANRLLKDSGNLSPRAGLRRELALIHATLAVAGFTRDSQPSRRPKGFPG